MSMSPTMPALAPSSGLAHIANDHNLKCASWRSRVFEQRQDAYPSPPASHEAGLQEPPCVRAITRHII